MRTSSEIINEYMNKRITPSELILIVQKETWNEAIQLAIENAEFEMQTIYTYHGNGKEPTISQKPVLNKHSLEKLLK